MSNPLVSICIPVKNGAQFIKETLESIAKQTYSNIEVIVGENCSSDKTRDIVESFAFKYQQIKIIPYDKPISFAQSCNKLINIAQGKYVALFHADDIYDSTIIEKSVNALEGNEIIGVFSNGKIINENSEYVRKYPGTLKIKQNTIFDFNSYMIEILNERNPLICPSAVIRREAFLTINGFNCKLKYIEDLDTWLRLLMQGNILVLSERLISYRMHPNQGSTIYGDRTRDKLSITLTYLTGFLKEHGLIEKYKALLNRSIAKDYLKIAFYAANLGRYLNFTSALQVSKSYYYFNKKLIYFALQRAPKKASYFLIRFFIAKLLIKNPPPSSYHA